MQNAAPDLGDGVSIFRGPFAADRIQHECIYDK
jgi:hypothetical protein